MNRDDEDLTALHMVAERLTTSVGSIQAEQSSLATPCSDWDLAALVDHITGGNWFTIAILAGAQAADAIAATMDGFGGRSATSEAAVQSLVDQLAAFLWPGVLDRTWNHVGGDLSGRQILQLRLHDLIVHCWDVEETLHPGATVPDGLVRWGLDELVREDSITAQHFGLVSVPVPQSPGEDATAYLEAFGR